MTDPVGARPDAVREQPARPAGLTEQEAALADAVRERLEDETGIGAAGPVGPTGTVVW